MRLVWIAAGTGGMWCGACARDLALVRGLSALGHDVQVVPIYLPLRVEGVDPTLGQPVLSGGIATWLREYLPCRLPRWCARLLSARPVLRPVAGLAGSTSPSSLGRLTVSMLSGEDGRQRAAVAEMTMHLRQLRPDAIHLTNSLLLGYAPALRRDLGLPIHVSLQGEEVFVGDLGRPWSDQARQLMRRHATAVDRFWAPHPRHAQAMATWLDITPERIAIVPPAIDPQAFPPRATAPVDPVVGHLGILIPRKGADLVAEAVRSLPMPARLHCAGQEPDRSFARRLRRDCAGLPVEFLGELPPVDKRRFLSACRVVVLGSRAPEERAMVALEALALGVPVVAPEAGIVPDLAACGAVAMYRPGDAADLARVLQQALLDPDRDRHAAAAPAWIAAHHGQAVAARIAERALS